MGCATATNTNNLSADSSVAPSSFFKPVCHPLPTDLGGGTSAVLDNKTVEYPVKFEGNNDNNDNNNVTLEGNIDNNNDNYGNKSEIELNRINLNPIESN